MQAKRLPNIVSTIFQNVSNAINKKLCIFFHIKGVIRKSQYIKLKKKKKDQISLFFFFYKLMKLCACAHNFKLAPTNSLYTGVGQNNSDTKIWNSNSSMNIM